MRLASPRALGLSAAALVVAGWLLGSTLSPPVARTQQRTAARASADAPLPPIVPLNKVAPQPDLDPPSPARNPFTFGRTVVVEEMRIAQSADAPIVATASEAALAATVSQAVGDEWRLLGLATAADGAMTAIVRGRGDVHLIRAGDRVAGDLLVSEVGDAGVRLQRADGSTIDLRLP